MKKRNNLFLFSFIISTCIHIPIYSWVGSFYFGGKEFSFREFNTKVPIFTYYPLPRVVKITPAPSSVKKEIPKAVHTNDPSKTIPLAKTETQKIPLSNMSKNKSSLIFQEKHQHKRPVTKVLMPTVENVDLRDAIIYDAFCNYYELLSTIIGRFAVYPTQARDEGNEGVAYVSFILRKSGHLGEVVLKKSSQNSLLDRAAMSAVQNASPFPPLPIELHKSEIRLNVPISFEID